MKVKLKKEAGINLQGGSEGPGRPRFIQIMALYNYSPILTSYQYSMIVPAYIFFYNKIRSSHPFIP